MTDLVVSTDNLVILPIFRSSETTDTMRVVITCAVHPLFQELVLMTARVQRSAVFDLVKVDRNRSYYALSYVQSPLLLNSSKFVLSNRTGCCSQIDRLFGTASLLENVLTFERRILLGAIRDPRAQIVAIVLNGVEEAIVRSTMVQ